LVSEYFVYYWNLLWNRINFEQFGVERGHTMEKCNLGKNRDKRVDNSSSGNRTYAAKLNIIKYNYREY